MLKTTSRLILWGALALGALGAIGGVTPGVATAAATSVSPFAGSYSGVVPGASAVSWPISISASGSVRGAYSFDFWEYHFSGSMRGHVGASGAMWSKGYESSYPLSTGGGGGASTASAFSPTYKNSFDFTATAAIDSSGNLVGTTDAGESFVWYRQ